MIAELESPLLIETPPPTRTSLGPRGLGGIVLAIEGTEAIIVAPVSWHDYIAVSEFRTCHRPQVRLAFDRGRLEVMTVAYPHEHRKWLLARLVEMAAFGLGLTIRGGGNMTVRREDLDRGFEPDECYYIQNAHRIEMVRPLDFQTDPPPDLAIEVEMSRKIIDRLPLYAALGIPEVWRVDGERLTIHLLGSDRVYLESPVGMAFPTIPAADWNDYLTQATTGGVNAILTEILTRTNGQSPRT